MDPEEKEKMEKRDWLAEKIQMLNTQLEGFEADVEKAVSLVYPVCECFCLLLASFPSLLRSQIVCRSCARSIRTVVAAPRAPTLCWALVENVTVCAVV